MKRKVLIEKKENHVWTFFLEEDQIAEIHCAKSDEQEKVHQIGDIYVAKVQNIVQNIGAAFLEIEPGVNCYFDLRDAQNAFFTHKIGKKPLCIGDELVVQISREAVKTKVPTVTGNISLTGRYAVLTHGNTRIGVSSKISKKTGKPIRSAFRNIRMTSMVLLSERMQKMLHSKTSLQRLNS